MLLPMPVLLEPVGEAQVSSVDRLLGELRAGAHVAIEGAVGDMPIEAITVMSPAMQLPEFRHDPPGILGDHNFQTVLALIAMLPVANQDAGDRRAVFTDSLLEDGAEETPSATLQPLPTPGRDEMES